MTRFDGPIHQSADDFIKSLPCHAQKPYPDSHIAVKNKKVADMLLSAFADGGNAELTAIAQYQVHAMTIDDVEISDMIFCISLVEMHHMHMVGNMIETLGGDLRYWRTNKKYWSGGSVNYGASICDKISMDITSEQAALNGYAELLRGIKLENNPDLNQVEAVIERIMEDEAFHLVMFTNAYEMNCISQQ